MTPAARTRTLAPVIALTFLFLTGAASPARADITAFIGLSPTPENHAVRGVKERKRGRFSITQPPLKTKIRHDKAKIRK